MNRKLKNWIMAVPAGVVAVLAEGLAKRRAGDRAQK